MCKLLVVCQDALDPIYMDLWKGDMTNHHSILRRKAVVEDNGVINTWPIWTTFATGEPRNKHGITTFCKTKADGRKRMWNREDVKTQRSIIYRQLNNMGLSVGWWALPVTSNPVEEINGFMVAENIGPFIGVYPEEIEDDINIDNEMWLNLYSHRVFGENNIPSPKKWQDMSKAYMQDVKAFMSSVTESVIRIYAKIPVDVLFVYYNKIDRIGHQCMNMEWIMRECYREADRNLASLLDATQPDDVMVISDHGMGVNPPRVVEVNYPHSSLYSGKNHTYLAGNHRNPGFIGSTSDVLDPRKYRMTGVKQLIMKHIQGD